MLAGNASYKRGTVLLSLLCVVTLIAVLVATETNTSDIAEEGASARRPSPEPGGQAT